MSSEHLSLSERLTAAVLGALFGGFIGLAIAWLLMFSATLHLLGVGSHSVSVLKSVAAGAAFFAAAGAVFGASAGTLVGYALSGLFEFERLLEHRRPWAIEALLMLVGIGIILWVSGVFAA